MTETAPKEVPDGAYFIRDYPTQLWQKRGDVAVFIRVERRMPAHIEYERALEEANIPFIVEGNSGIPERNNLLPANDSDYDVYEPCYHKLVDEWIPMKEPYRLPKQEWISRVEEVFEEARKRVFRDEIERRLAKIGADVVEIREFNKLMGHEYARELGYYIFTRRVTTRFNSTVIIGRLKPTIRVPKNLMGLVIGKGGKNIKKASQELGCRIKVEEVE